MPEDNSTALRSMAQVLRGWRQAGIDFLPQAQAESPIPSADAPITIAPPGAASTHESTIPASRPTTQETDRDMPRAKLPVLVANSVGDSTPIWPDPHPKHTAERITLLGPIRSEVVACTRCKELAACRTQTVFGVGNVSPRLCFFGEAPGADEDRQGEPFVGRAGQLLDKIIEAMTLKRENVYILNTLKCRPPSNRTPLPDEVENCREYFTRQLEVLRPEFLVCLGACAAQALLRTKESIGKLRGRSHDFRGIKVYATYHPAYLLRNPPAKRDVWEDMKIVMKEMGMAVPKG